MALALSCGTCGWVRLFAFLWMLSLGSVACSPDPVQDLQRHRSTSARTKVLILLHPSCYFHLDSPLEFRWGPSTNAGHLLDNFSGSFFIDGALSVFLLCSGCFLLAVPLAPQHQCRIPNINVGILPTQWFFCFFVSAAIFAWPLLWTFVGHPRCQCRPSC